MTKAPLESVLESQIYNYARHADGIKVFALNGKMEVGEPDLLFFTQILFYIEVKRPGAYLQARQVKFIEAVLPEHPVFVLDDLQNAKDVIDWFTSEAGQESIPAAHAHARLAVEVLRERTNAPNDYDFRIHGRRVRG